MLVGAGLSGSALFACLAVFFKARLSTNEAEFVVIFLKKKEPRPSLVSGEMLCTYLY